MPLTNGFLSADRRRRHFRKHRAEFGVATEADYEHLADTFLGGPLQPATMEGVRRGGDIVRYDTITQEFGVLSATGHIRTYFKADPAVHGFPTNLDYFYWECLK